MDKEKEIIKNDLKQIVPTREAFVSRVGDVVLTMVATQAIVIAANGVMLIGKGVKKGIGMIQDHFKKNPEESEVEVEIEEN